MNVEIVELMGRFSAMETLLIEILKRHPDKDSIIDGAVYAARSMHAQNALGATSLGVRPEVKEATDRFNDRISKLILACLNDIKKEVGLAAETLK